MIEYLLCNYDKEKYIAENDFAFDIYDNFPVNDGHVKMRIDEEDVYKSFYEFYHKGSNKVDMLRHKGAMDFEDWDKCKYVKLAKDNPIKYLIKTDGEFFRSGYGCLIGLFDDMKDIILDERFVEHMKGVLIIG